ncbi:LysR family transcriptional regulator [Psychrosphaera aestuarii]|uniref:LysR family transcriptional regulator n=1 Tax=Psychrosphaera aestuarii TaxID=1266052 RepID=UPI001B31B1FE|nr:LysR family transcriptional regulator [Psychrosphaera aestuarii]
MINQVWLRTYCTLVDTGHFTKTAEQLYMTQSGVSQQIKKLEGQLAVQLLIREGKSFTLTSAGQVLYKKGKELLSSINDLELRIKEDSSTVGNISLSSPGSIGLKLYPELLALQKKHPNLTIEYAFAPNQMIIKHVQNKEIDIGLVTRNSLEPDIQFEAIGQEELVLVTPKNTINPSWQNLETLGFIDHPDASHHAQLLLGANYKLFTTVTQFTRTGFSNQIGLILEPVALGLGFTVLPKFTVHAFNRCDEVMVHRLPKAVFETIYLVSNKKNYKTKRVAFVESKLIEFLEEEAR